MRKITVQTIWVGVDVDGGCWSPDDGDVVRLLLQDCSARLMLCVYRETFTRVDVLEMICS